MNEEERRYRNEMRRRKRRNALIVKCVIFAILVAVLVVAIWFVTGGSKKVSEKAQGRVSATTQNQNQNQNQNQQGADNSGGNQNGNVIWTPEGSSDGENGEESQMAANAMANQRTDTLKKAENLAMQYDYEGALELLNSIPDYESDAEVIALMADYETQRSNLVAVSPYDVTHVFFHSLVVDPKRGFSMTGDEAWDVSTPGFCQWMTTVYEFDQLMNQMYERGFVLISLYDMIDEYEDEEGVVHVTPKDIYLPQGKTPFVMSLDDTCYYHSYDGRGTATKLIVGDDGTPTCEYIDENGNTLIGSYDCIPRLDDFIDEHPDFSYKGAKGTVALTGYNGILGYRTDYCYRDRVDLYEDQEAWLNAHPDYNWEEECAKAKEVADCIKEDGWTFASHTWGHIAIYDTAYESLVADTQKFKEYVEPLIGETDIVIFAHGQDLASWDEEYSETEKFKFMKSQGYNIFCNVDSTPLFVQIEDSFLRQGRRNLDGYRLWQAVYGGYDMISDLCDPATVFDPDRPTDDSYYEL